MAQNACVTRESIFFLSLAAGNQTHMCNIIIVRQRNATRSVGKISIIFAFERYAGRFSCFVAHEEEVSIVIIKDSKMRIYSLAHCVNIISPV